MARALGSYCNCISHSCSPKHQRMGSVFSEKPHAVCVPYPAQGHIIPMMQLAKLLYSRGFHITFVNTQFNHNRLLRSRGSHSLTCYQDFRFESIPDGLPPSDPDATQDIPALCDSTSKTCLVPFRDLLTKLNTSSGVPPVTCIVSDGVMSFTQQVADELCIPEVLFWTTSACGFMAYLHYADLLQRGYTPLKDEVYLTNGYLDTQIDWIPGMPNVRLKDLPTFIRTTDPRDIMVNFCKEQAQNAFKSSALILNTFDELEHEVIDAIRSKYPQLYTVGSLSMLSRCLPETLLKSLGSNLWKEEPGCLEWLDRWDAGSVVYVNFGSITVMTPQQLMEFAWGLANSKKPFMWVVRPDLVKGDSAILPPEFTVETKERGLIVSWCPQEQVLSHASVGGFLTHCGWNSTLESVCAGVPVMCWPFFAEQQTNCRYACNEWGIGMEIDSNVKREEVEGLVIELMDGEKGKEMRAKAVEWKERATKAAKSGGSSHDNLNRLVNEVLLR